MQYFSIILVVACAVFQIVAQNNAGQVKNGIKPQKSLVSRQKNYEAGQFCAFVDPAESDKSINQVDHGENKVELAKNLVSRQNHNGGSPYCGPIDPFKKDRSIKEADQVENGIELPKNLVSSNLKARQDGSGPYPPNKNGKSIKQSRHFARANN